MQTQTIAEAQDLVAFAAQILDGLHRAEERLAALNETGGDGQEARLDELRWLQDAQRHLILACEKAWSALVRALPLPEFEAERRAKGQALLASWVNAVEGLLSGITAHVSIHNPVVEVLFPHHKFDKLRRSAAQARAYKSEFERQRTSTYVVRLSGEPEYAFLPPLLERVDRARAELAAHEAPAPRPEAELDALRTDVLSCADALRDTLARVRLLSEAALLTHSEWLAELGLDTKPRRRSRAA